MRNTLLLLIILYTLPVHSFEYRMRRYSVNEGLSQCDVTYIHQDKRGYIWFATYDGLNRFDGISNVIHYSNENHHHTLPSNRVLCITEDENIWAGTQGAGIFEINHQTSEIRSFYIRSDQTADREWNIVKRMIISPDNPSCVWLLTPQGIFKAKIPDDNTRELKVVDQIPVKEGFKWAFINGDMIVVNPEGVWLIKHYNTLYKRSEEHLLQGQTARDLLIANEGCYISANKGIYLYDGNTTKQVFHRDGQSMEGRNPASGLLGKDKDENVLYYTPEEGVVRFLGIPSPRNGQSLKTYPNDYFVNNHINQLFVDRSNTLWIASRNKGAAHIDLMEKGFNNIRIDHVRITDNISHLKADNQQNLWIGSLFKGVVIIDSTDRVINYPYQNHFGRSIVGIDKDKSGNIWILGSNGLFIAEGINKPPVLVNKLRGFEQIAIRGSLNGISCDSIGVWGKVRNGIIYAEKNRDNLSIQFTHFDIIESRKIYKEPHSNRLWISTNGYGLYCLTANTKKELSFFRHYTAGGESEQCLSSNSVWDVKLVDSTLWIGTDNGLDFLDSKGEIKHVQSVRRKIYCIAPDKMGNLWLNTSRGLLKYDPKNDKTESYNTTEGLPDNGLSFASESLPNGRVYVGSINGLTYFNPDLFTTNHFIPPVVFTSLEVFNNPVMVGDEINGRVLLPHEIDNTEKITLKHNENHLTLHFMALQYNNVERMKYRYRLKGFDRDWVVRNYRQNSVTYSNLPAGTYRFELFAANNDGLWTTEPKTLLVEICRPPWRATWAYGLYALLFCLIGYIGLMYYKARRERKKKEIIEQVERQKEKELIDFFGNLMHEIRTPLTLIANPVKEIIETDRLQPDDARKLKTVSRNTSRLLHLINLFAIRKFIQLPDEETQVMPSIAEMKINDIGETIRNAAEAFSISKESKQIDYHIIVPDEKILIPYNENKIEIAITNLISNAFKFTSKGGCITVKAGYTETEVVISVKDTGIGIPSEEMPLLFNRFFKGKNAHSLGTGIGLHFTKQIVEEHSGKITVESKINEGATFTITLPVEQVVTQAPAVQPKEEKPTEPPKEMSHEVKFKLLLVDDDPSIINYLSEELKPEYTLSYANDGKTALEQIRRGHHDLVISDIAMEGMDGLELCRIIKRKQIGTTIPVILLSGKSSEVDQLEGYRSGADDYLIKPISIKLLKAKIESILENRKSRMHTIEEIVMQSAESAPDRELLNRVLLYIESNISDNSLTVEAIAAELGTNRVQLHRHISRITGKGVSDFIREIKMTKSIILLRSKNYSIKEVAYMVGYTTPSFFSRAFKNYYGKTPREVGGEERS